MADAKRAMRVKEFCQRYGIGITKTYEEIAAGRLSIKKAGKTTLIPVEAAERWLAALPSMGKGMGKAA